jgi:hypothetical protein
VILFIYFLFLHLAVPLGSVRGTPDYRGIPVGNPWVKVSPAAEISILYVYSTQSTLEQSPVIHFMESPLEESFLLDNPLPPHPHIAVTEAHFFLPVEITQHEKVDREKCSAVDPVGTQTPP